MRLRKLDSFQGRTVLITGASSGIGREAAVAFARSGASVVLVARRRGSLAETATVAREGGGRVLVAPADVTRPDSVAAAFRKAVAEFGGIDIVINNAGVMKAGSVANLAADDLQAMLDVNLFGALYVMQEAVRTMRGKGGHIVNVASLAGRRGYSPLGGYSATKFALIGLTEALRTELVGEPIHVSLILPGVVDTPMAAAVQGKGSPEGELWPKALNLPASWVVQAMFLAIRFRLTEVGVPPGAALLEKLAALAPGVPDAFLHWATSSRRKPVGREAADDTARRAPTARKPRRRR